MCHSLDYSSSRPYPIGEGDIPMESSKCLLDWLFPRSVMAKRVAQVLEWAVLFFFVLYPSIHTDHWPMEYFVILSVFNNPSHTLVSCLFLFECIGPFGLESSKKGAQSIEKTLNIYSLRGIQQQTVCVEMRWPSSLRLDQEILLGAGNSVQRLRMYPYFDAAHYILMVLAVREDLGPNFVAFSRRHPLSCWLSSMVICFAGSFLANFLLGEPIVAVFKRQEDILLATAIWYMVFYSPFDIVYKLAKFTPIKIVLSIMKECQRVYKINHGVLYATKLYPNAHLIHIMVGTAKGAGSGIIRIFEQLIRGVWTPSQSEILRPSFTTKACVIASIILTLEKSTGYLSLPHEITYLGLLLFFIYFKLSAILLEVTDPLMPFENLFCAIFMGGIWDALSRALTASQERRTINGKVENGSVQSEHKKDQ